LNSPASTASGPLEAKPARTYTKKERNKQEKKTCVSFTLRITIQQPTAGPPYAANFFQVFLFLFFSKSKTFLQIS
jgi:hypothetical protein